MLTPGFSETSALIAVLEQKSFMKAAEQLGLSPGRVSALVACGGRPAPKRPGHP
jgi:hypothetical protein